MKPYYPVATGDYAIIDNSSNSFIPNEYHALAPR